MSIDDLIVATKDYLTKRRTQQNTTSERAKLVDEGNNIPTIKQREAILDQIRTIDREAASVLEKLWEGEHIIGIFAKDK